MATPNSAETVQPPVASDSGRPTLDFAEVKLHAGHEQRRGHANQEHHRHEAFELHQPQDVGADDDSEHDFEDHGRHSEAERNLGQQWRQNGGAY
jgi:hypothetical protein